MLGDKTPEENSILFMWFNNYAGVLIKTPSKSLLIDPVDVKAKSFPQIDAILITHEHYDHLDQLLVAKIQKATNCTVIADQTSAKSLQTVIPKGKLVATQAGDETKLGEVSVRAFKCKHQAATPASFIVTSEGGLKVWHTADSLPFPEMATIGQAENLDVVFCTVGIAQGCTPETGSEIAWLTKPKVAVPYHTNNVENQEKFFQILRKELPKTTCLVPELYKIYQISKGKKKN